MVNHNTTCLICGHKRSHSILNPGPKPLATIAWPGSYEEAISISQYPQEYDQCTHCSHVWNHLFDWNNVSYDKKPNKMFNQGVTWKAHQSSLVSKLGCSVPENPCIIEVGCGDGVFLRELAKECKGKARCIGFDPSGDYAFEDGLIAFNKSMFVPARDMVEYKPDMIILRHVIEHLQDPASFLNSLAWSAFECSIETYLYCEVPCIDRVFETVRLVDFYYEHHSHFTTSSFSHLLSSLGDVIDIHHVNSGEVLCGLVHLRVDERELIIADKASAVALSVPMSIDTIRGQLQEILQKNKKVAIWGGTGKCSSFMHLFGINAEHFPIVVDSDIRKVNSYVPGIGQKILPVSSLLDASIDVLIIPTQWRSFDILEEAKSMGLHFETVLIEHEGRLIDLNVHPNPYSVSGE